MSVGFIGAGQAAQSLVRGFAAAGELCTKPGIQVCAVQARRFQSARELTGICIYCCFTLNFKA